jgi:hypothetical protein
VESKVERSESVLPLFLYTFYLQAAGSEGSVHLGPAKTKTIFVLAFLSVQAARLEGEVVRAHEGLVQGENQMESLNSGPGKGFSKMLNIYSSLFCRKFVG